MTDYEIRCSNCGRKNVINVEEMVNPVYICACGGKTKLIIGKGFIEREFKSRQEFSTFRPKKKIEAKDMPYNQVVEMEED